MRNLLYNSRIRRKKEETKVKNILSNYVNEIHLCDIIIDLRDSIHDGFKFNDIYDDQIEEDRKKYDCLSKKEKYIIWNKGMTESYSEFSHFSNDANCYCYLGLKNYKHNFWNFYERYDRFDNYMKCKGCNSVFQFGQFVCSSGLEAFTKKEVDILKKYDLELNIKE